MTNSFIYSFAPFFKTKDLYSSAASGQLFQVQRLLAKGCDPNLPHTSGLLPIHFAASRGHVELVAFLLESKQQHVDVVDKEGETALLKAAYTGQYTVVDYLISQAGADYTMADRDGWTALHNACSAGHVGLVQLLVFLPNTNVDIQSAQGHTPLMNAASKGHVDIVLFLLERANPLIKNKFGETAYDVAAAAGETYLCQVLESHEALWQTMDPLSFHVTIPVVLSQVQVGTDQHFDHDVWFHQSKSIPGKHKVALPNTEWFWLTGWSIDGTFPCTAADGWSYAKQGDDHWYAEMPAKPAGWVRKRRWMRIMKKRMNLLMDNQVMDEDAGSEHEEDNHRLSTVSTTMAKATFISSSQSQQLLQEQINEVPLMSRPSSDDDEDEDVQVQHMNGTWENNELALDCRQCHRVFNLIIRKHHCRRCGQVVCDKCSSHRALLPYSNSIHPPSISSQQVYLLSLQPQRVCDGCLDDMSPSSNDMTECPVCNKRLKEFKTAQEQEQHVQDCLRLGSNATATSTRYIVYKLIPTSVLIGQECVICFEEFEADDTVTRLSCLCSFHRHCINHWFSKGKECPIHAQ